MTDWGSHLQDEEYDSPVSPLLLSALPSLVTDMQLSIITLGLCVHIYILHNSSHLNFRYNYGISDKCVANSQQ